MVTPININSRSSKKRVWEEQSANTDRTSAVWEIFAIPLELSMLTVLRDCPFSMLQPLQFVPVQRLWNNDFTCFTDLFWRPCKQACPQKQASASTPFTQTPKTRTTARNILYGLLFFTGAIPMDYSFSAFYLWENYTSIANMLSIKFSLIIEILHTKSPTANQLKYQWIYLFPLFWNNYF